MNKTLEYVLTHKDPGAWSYLTRSAVYKKDKWCTTHNAMCYADLKWGSALAFQVRLPTTPDSIKWGQTCRRVRGTPEARQEAIDTGNSYINFLIDPKKSPWRSVAGVFEVIRDETGNATGMYAEDTSKLNRAMTHNFCIAVRMAWETPEKTLRWWQLLQRGLDPCAALYYAMYTTPPSAGRITLHNMCSHTWTTYSSHSMFVPSLVALDNPPLHRLSREKFSTPARGLPQSNFIWMLPAGRAKPPAVGAEFPKGTVQSMGGTFIKRDVISEADFNKNLKQAVKNRRQMEKEYLEKLEEKEK